MGNSIQSTLPEKLPLFQEAHARRTDPQTSKDAAKSVANIGVTRATIMRILRDFGPFTDEQIAHTYELQRKNTINIWDYPKASPSGLRSRRSELVKMGLVKDTGRTQKLSTGRQATVWSVA